MPEFPREYDSGDDVRAGDTGDNPYKTAGHMMQPEDLDGHTDQKIADMEAIPVVVVQANPAPALASNRAETGRTQVGGVYAPAMSQLVGRQELRRKITIQNKGAVNIVIGFRPTTQASEAFLLAPNEKEVFDYRGDIYVGIENVGGTAGLVQWWAAFADGR